MESHTGSGCLSLESVVWCQVEVFVSGWSPVHRSPTECGVSESDREASIMRRPWPTRGCCAMEKNAWCKMPLSVRNNYARRSSLFWDAARRRSVGGYYGMPVSRAKQTVPGSLRTDVLFPNKFRCLEDIKSATASWPTDHKCRTALCLVNWLSPTKQGVPKQWTLSSKPPQRRIRSGKLCLSLTAAMSSTTRYTQRFCTATMTGT
jgi:hypothetical protein